MWDRIAIRKVAFFVGTIVLMPLGVATTLEACFAVHQNIEKLYFDEGTDVLHYFASLLVVE
jgi:hypothetical protein